MLPRKQQSRTGAAALLLVVFLALGAVLSLGSAAQTQTTITLQQGLEGYQGCTDTYIEQYQPNQNYSGQEQIRAGYRQQYASLLRFDVSSLPPDAIVAQATLQLYARGWSGASVGMDAFAINRDVNLAQATWNQAQTGSSWGVAGCNHVPTDRQGLAESSIVLTLPDTWYEFDLTALVRRWLDGSMANNGVLLRATDPLSTHSFQFASAENGNAALRPRLIISFDLPTATPTEIGTPTHTPTDTLTPTITETPTDTLTPTATPTFTETPTATPTATVPTILETQILQQGVGGYTGFEDTYIYQFDPNNSSLASSQHLRVGQRQQLASIVRFDLSPIPSDATVVQATLHLYAAAWNGGNLGVGAYQIKRSTNASQATWMQAENGNLWAIPGCNDLTTDRSEEAVGTFGTNGIEKWYTLDLTALAKQWHEGSVQNHGVLLRALSVFAPGSYYFGSANSGNPIYRPKLELVYARPVSSLTATPSPTGPVAPTPTGSATPIHTATATVTQPGLLTATPTPTGSATSVQETPGTPSVTTTPTRPLVETTIVLQQGRNRYAGCEDTYIYRYAPNENYCGLETFRVGYRQQFASLIRFDLGALPPDAVIKRATLQVYATGWTGSQITIDLYPVTRQFSVCQATWNQAQIGNAWALPGCNHPSLDRRAPAEALVMATLPNRWYEAELTNLVGQWASGSLANNGLLLFPQEPYSNHSFHFATAQNDDPNIRPKLVITFESFLPEPSPTATEVPTSTSTATVPPETPGTPTLTPTRTLPGGPETVLTLQQGVGGYQGCADTMLYEYDPDNADDFWGQPQLRIGDKQRYAGLIRFTMPALPLDAVVTQATLELYAEGWNGANIALGAYNVLRYTVVNDATWNQARSGDRWALPGCNDTLTDRRAIAESVINTQGVSTWYGFDLTSVVEGWLNGSLPNNGILLRGASSVSRSAFNFASSESGWPGFRPRLVIAYRRADGPIPRVSATLTPTRPATGGTPTQTLPAGPSPTTPQGDLITVEYQQGRSGYRGCQDTSLYQYDPDSEEFWHAGQFRVGERQRYVSLIRFDLAGFPTNAVVAQATLRLYAEGWGGSNIAFGAHRVVRTTVVNEATWNRSRVGELWGAPGCNAPDSDYRTTPESTVATSGIGQWYELDLTALVQGWVHQSTPNNGVLLRTLSTISRTSVSFASSESQDPTVRPLLIIRYRLGNTPIPSPTATQTGIPSITPTRTMTPIPAGDTLVIAHITDAHIGKQWLYSDRLPGVIQALNGQAQIMVDTGDCTEHGTLQETLQYLNLVKGNITIPWRAVAGNHDEPAIFAENINPLEWTLDVGGYRLIGINMYRFDYDTLYQSLTMDKPCVVFGHLPLDNLPIPVQAQIRQLFTEFRVPLYVAGHIHEDSLTVDAQSGTTLLVGDIVGQGDYRLITMSGYGVSVSFENPF